MRGGTWRFGSAKFLVLCLGLQAFCAVLVLMDGAEQWRAWKTAAAWSEEERAAAGAGGAETPLFLAGACQAVSVAVSALSFLGLFSLGVSMAGRTDRSGEGAAERASLGSRAAAACARGAALGSAVLGPAYAGLALAYRLSLGGRGLLRGPVMDYSLALQPPIAFGAVFLALIGILTLVTRFRGGGRGE